MVVSTYQAASGAGQAAMEELEQQTREALEGGAAAAALPLPPARPSGSHRALHQPLPAACFMGSTWAHLLKTFLI
jgi:aspartate-semialdehyde dehydrogenase